MDKTFNNTINISLLIIISFFLHIIIIAVVIIPDMPGRSLFDVLAKRVMPEEEKGGRAVKVKIGENINQNLKREITEQTFISDKDSAAQGFLTPGNSARWYSETTDLKLGQKGAGKSGGSASQRIVNAGGQKVILNDESEMLMYVSKFGRASSNVGDGSNVMKLPQPNLMSRTNTLFFSNSGLFSLNTVEFKHYAFAKRIVDKISSNWYPPIMANARIGGYAPGSTRIMAIPPQEVRAYFAINENGAVVRSGILDSYGNKSLDESCLDAIRFSKSFGPVPDDLKKKMQNGVMVIPFIFGYGM